MAIAKSMAAKLSHWGVLSGAVSSEMRSFPILSVEAKTSATRSIRRSPPRVGALRTYLSTEMQRSRASSACAANSPAALRGRLSWHARSPYKYCPDPSLRFESADSNILLRTDIERTRRTNDVQRRANAGVRPRNACSKAAARRQLGSAPRRRCGIPLVRPQDAAGGQGIYVAADRDQPRARSGREIFLAHAGRCDGAGIQGRSTT